MKTLPACFFCFTTLMLGQGTYSITAIEPTAGFQSTYSSRINDLGSVAGWVENQFGAVKAMIYKAGATKLLNRANLGRGFAINNSDFVVGFASFPTGNDAALFTSTGTTNLAANPTGSEFTGSIAYAINDSSLIAGTANTTFGTLLAVRFDNDAVTALPFPSGSWINSQAADINCSGTVVGSVSASPVQKAVRWLLNGQVEFLASEDKNSAGYGINCPGNMTGYWNNQAAIWDNQGLVKLGRLPGSANAFGLAINDFGVVVGESPKPDGTRNAFVYKNGQMYDLQTLILNGSGWDLWYANGVNNLGQITGVGIFNGTKRAFVLTPQ